MLAAPAAAFAITAGRWRLDYAADISGRQGDLFRRRRKPCAARRPLAANGARVQLVPYSVLPAN